MLYSKIELEYIVREGTPNEKITAQIRYLHKVRQKETKKLLPHEREFITGFLPRVYVDQETKEAVFNVYELDFCADALLKQLFLTYQENLDFLMPAFNGVKYLEPHEIAADKNNFYVLFDHWKAKLLSTYSDAYLHEVRLEYHRKIEILEQIRKQGLYGRFFYERKALEQQLNAFYMYYVTRAFFRANKSDFVLFQAAGRWFSINVYSYVHIVSRHYIPKLNGIDPERSFNNSLPFIDPFNLPYSLKDLILDYFSNAPPGRIFNEEWLIFSYRNEFYMIWWKRKRLKEIQQQFGYELRTLYKIEAGRDWQKINYQNAFVVNNDLKYYY
ncbi:hypothetical protein [Mucilaginibacter sp.]|jgi:hypothetical protein|uniref:hypothetical protein n=1 Tax=Mucilaginibacter sp. TaxID=1882438 RepID=UPI002C37D527|nr:hypothetical protein [Mucilaginibacter sp.]HTI60115.1 hypothetical protein [Mucilaginibacter sp.]